MENIPSGALGRKPGICSWYSVQVLFTNCFSMGPLSLLTVALQRPIITSHSIDYHATSDFSNILTKWYLESSSYQLGRAKERGDWYQQRALWAPHPAIPVCPSLPFLSLGSKGGEKPVAALKNSGVGVMPSRSSPFNFFEFCFCSITIIWPLVGIP